MNGVVERHHFAHANTHTLFLFLYLANKYLSILLIEFSKWRKWFSMGAQAHAMGILNM